ncbi:TetR/AcrR family transcriptional regulator [Phytomonospora sp. NPDC050363]|uniref:TetR/AcrR family transcriptional regulator n=1 Tax=Phytomonospora sp. NPDC050363 TaxID=3155642 RepID=UPI0034112298
MDLTPRQAEARDRILDAGLAVLSEKGLIRATTKEIAKAAGYSEANLYKHFSSKDDLMVAVFMERLPALGALLTALIKKPGTGDLRANLEDVAATAMAFFRGSVPIAGAILAAPELLRKQRASDADDSKGPWVPMVALTAYLSAEKEAGRLTPGDDPEVMAKLLMGACMQESFIHVVRGSQPPSPAEDRELAARLVGTLLKK